MCVCTQGFAQAASTWTLSAWAAVDAYTATHASSQASQALHSLIDAERALFQTPPGSGIVGDLDVSPLMVRLHTSAVSLKFFQSCQSSVVYLSEAHVQSCVMACVYVCRKASC